MQSPPKRRALLSVADKEGIVEFANILHKAGFEILSTGGTEKALMAAGIPVLSAEKVTGFPEAFGGRVKTMHPLIMGGVLFKRDDQNQVAEAKTLGIERPHLRNGQAIANQNTLIYILINLRFLQRLRQRLSEPT